MMKSLGGLVILIAILAIGVGFYRGWFVLTTERHSGSNKVDVNLTVDPDQVQADAAHATP